MRFVRLDCMKQGAAERLFLHGIVENYGRLSCSCRGHCLVYDPFSSGIEAIATRWDHSDDTTAQGSNKSGRTMIESYSRVDLFADFYLYTQAVAAEGAKDKRALDWPQFFPTQSRSRRFVMILIVTFGSRRIFDYVEVQILRTIGLNMDIEDTLKSLKIKRSKSWNLRRKVKRVVRDYEPRLDDFARSGIEVVWPR